MLNGQATQFSPRAGATNNARGPIQPPVMQTGVIYSSSQNYSLTHHAQLLSHQTSMLPLPSYYYANASNPTEFAQQPYMHNVWPQMPLPGSVATPSAPFAPTQDAKPPVSVAPSPPPAAAPKGGKRRRQSDSSSKDSTKMQAVKGKANQFKGSWGKKQLEELQKEEEQAKLKVSEERKSEELKLLNLQQELEGLVHENRILSENNTKLAEQREYWKSRCHYAMGLLDSYNTSKQPENELGLVLPTSSYLEDDGDWISSLVTSSPSASKTSSPVKLQKR